MKEHHVGRFQLGAYRFFQPEDIGGDIRAKEFLIVELLWLENGVVRTRHKKQAAIFLRFCNQGQPYRYQIGLAEQPITNILMPSGLAAK